MFGSFPSNASFTHNQHSAFFRSGSNSVSSPEVLQLSPKDTWSPSSSFNTVRGSNVDPTLPSSVSRRRERTSASRNNSGSSTDSIKAATRLRKEQARLHEQRLKKEERAAFIKMGFDPNVVEAVQIASGLPFPAELGKSIQEKGEDIARYNGRPITFRDNARKLKTVSTKLHERYLSKQKEFLRDLWWTTSTGERRTEPPTYLSVLEEGFSRLSRPASPYRI
jgi:hypothetical protein